MSLAKLLRALSPRRAWLRHDLKWITDRIADEQERHRRHGITMTMLHAEAARVRAKLGDVGSTGTVNALWPRDKRTT